MNRRPGKSSRSRRTVKALSHDQAAAAAPYIRSVLASVREHRLEAIHAELKARRMSERPGRPDRAAIMAHQELTREAARQHRLYDEAVDELEALGVQCVDPVNGLAVIPFVHDDRAAWYLFELHAEPSLTAWRYHDDPIELVRNLDELTAPRPTAFFA